MADQRLLICPYCGETQPESDRCRECKGLFEPLSRQATHNSMGPWFVRDDLRPYQPGCSYETLVKLIRRGRVTRYTIVRGPTTRQFWTIAKRVPGISHYFGACYQCDASVDADDRSCHACGATFGGFLDRNFLGLPEYRPLPWEADRSGQRRPEVEPGEPTDWRQQTASAAGGPRGISSFATDEELLGEAEQNGGTKPPAGRVGEPAGPPPPAPAPQQSTQQHAERAAAAVEEPQPALSQTEREPAGLPAPAPEHSGSATALRAMQRKLARQQRTIRLLAYATIALGAVAIILGLLWLDLRSTPAPQTEPAADPAATTGEEQRTPGLDPADPLDERSEFADRARMPPIPADEPAEEERTQSATFTADHQTAYEEAAHLIERAEDSDRELSLRIADLERAVAVLEQLKREVAESALPDDFSQTLRDARRTLERLRLRDFFP